MFIFRFRTSAIYLESLGSSRIITFFRPFSLTSCLFDAVIDFIWKLNKVLVLIPETYHRLYTCKKLKNHEENHAALPLWQVTPSYKS